MFKLLRYMSSLLCYIFKVLESWEFAFFSCNYYAVFKTMSCIYSCSLNISETIITFVEYFIFYQVLPYLLDLESHSNPLRKSLFGRKGNRLSGVTSLRKGHTLVEQEGLKAKYSDLRCPCFFYYPLLPVKMNVHNLM